jgi:hypothetical protein
VAHMLFLAGSTQWFATHPPLLERVRALDPHVNQAQLDSMLRRSRADLERRDEFPMGEDTAAQRPLANMLAMQGTAVPAAAQLIAASAGEPRPGHLDYAVAVRHALPAGLRGSAEDSGQAQALMLALLVFADPAHQHHERQLAVVAAKSGAAMAHRVQHAAQAAASLSPMLRLPAVLQLFPALRTLVPAERLLFIQLLQELMRTDGRFSVFDYTLEKLVTRGLAIQAAPREPHGTLSLEDRATQLGVVFAVLARHGARDAVQARQAYEAGIATLLPRNRPAYSVIDNWAPTFDRALDELCALQILAKQLLIEGLARTIAHDGMLTPPEAELLRAICAVLECPLPPLLPDATDGAGQE